MTGSATFAVIQLRYTDMTHTLILLLPFSPNLNKEKTIRYARLGAPFKAWVIF